MNNRSQLVIALVACVLLGSAFYVIAERTALSSKPLHGSLATAARDMADVADHFLASLSPEQSAKATFEFKSDERLNWHFIPRERKGLPLREMTGAQRALAQALLSSGLSQRGYVSAVTIMSLDQILADIEQGKGPRRDPDGYFFSIFGKPSADGPWGWRVEGHHLAVNFTIAKGQFIAAGPAFMGSNPADVKDGPRKGLRVLGQEEDLGRQLVLSLGEQQKAKAVLPIEAPRDIFTAAARKAVLDDARGIAFADLNDGQKVLLFDLIRLYAGRLRTEIAEDDLRRIDDAGIEKVRFAWAGSTEKYQPHYYRVLGPTFLVEYDNTQNNSNHIHTVWRDLQNDFGEDLLKKHYDGSDHGHGHDAAK